MDVNLKYIGKIWSNATCLKFFINNMVLRCFFQLHVSALAVSHLQVDHYFLSKANITISSVNCMVWERGSTVVKVLCYKSEGLWFNAGW